MKDWNLDHIPWTAFEPSLVDPEVVKIVKAAALVEFNGHDYAAYLCSVFNDDPTFQDAARAWAVEEVQHGAALRRWAELADPSFDFDAAFKIFTKGVRLPLEAEQSVRGSRVGELVARCIVETGTSSWYTALREASSEPVLREICRLIAADELRHYKLFYAHLNRYLLAEKIGKWRRLRIAAARVGESEDDELAYAYYAANDAPAAVYDHRIYNRAYARRAYSFYREHHIARVTSMVFKAVGLKPQGSFHSIVAKGAWWLMDSRAKRLAKSSC